MAVDERSRRSLYDLLKEPLGMAATNALLEQLPPLGSDLATRSDLHVEIADVHVEIAKVRGEVAEIRGEVVGLRAEIDKLRAELSLQIAEMGARLARQQVLLFVGMFAAVVALVVGLNGPWSR